MYETAFVSSGISTDGLTDLNSHHIVSTTGKSGCMPSRRGFTLSELLVASTIALSVMAAVATLFGTFGRAASDTQSIADMTNRLRMTASRLRRDLAGVTAPMRPPLSPDGNTGYFELIEGPLVDSTAAPTAPLLADVDDVLMFTTQSAGPPFQGRYVVSGSDRRIESSSAEVAWFCRASPASAQTVAGLTLQTLYRRQLLVEGYVGAAPFHDPTSAATNQITFAGTMPDLLNLYDMSLRAAGAGVFVPNTLSDLSMRQNRFLHGAWNVPFSTATPGATFDSSSGREGEDVVMTNVISFDVRVFDPDARPRLNGSIPVLPTDRVAGGYDALPAFSGTGSFSGCFVDLGTSTADMATLVNGLWITGTSPLTRPTNVKSRLVAPAHAPTYDTWSTTYETNGIDDDSDTIVDDATNGADDSIPADGLPDDAGETETAPPYSAPLTAIEVRIRCYDPTSRQVRQASIRHAFAN
ncbi:MAG: prepilin-type N-terminal cleavage/methylation domain-containing protein [Pirellulales bacterium]